MKPRSNYRRTAIAVALLAFLTTAARSIATAPETYPVADTAATSLYTLEASEGRLEVGSYSRFGWNHPGPLLYQLLAGPYALSGRREIALKWAALALNVTSLGACLYLLARRSPSTGLAAALAFTPLLWREQRLLFTPWNPFIPVLALPLCMVAAADIAAGGARHPRVSLLAFVLSMSLCVQAHAGLVIPCAACCLVAGFGSWRHRADAAVPASVRWRAPIEALALFAVLWALPLAAEMRDSPGNIHRMVTFLMDQKLPRSSTSYAVSAAAYMTLGPMLPSWSVEYDDIPRHLPLAWTVAWAALIVAVVWTARGAHRRGHRFEAACSVVAALAISSAAIAARGIVGQMSDYLLLWASGAGAMAVAVVLGRILQRIHCLSSLRSETAGIIVALPVLVWTGVGGLRLEGKHAEQARDTTIRALATDLAEFCRRNSIVRPALAYAPGDTWQEAVGIVLQFAKADRYIAADDAWVHIVGRSFAKTGTEDAEFYIMPAGSQALPEAERVEWVTTRGAYRILRLWRNSGPGGLSGVAGEMPLTYQP